MISDIVAVFKPGVHRFLALLETSLEAGLREAYYGRINLYTCRRWMAGYADIAAIVDALQAYRDANLPVEDVRAKVKAIRDADYRQRRAAELMKTIAACKADYDRNRLNAANVVRVSRQDYDLLAAEFGDYAGDAGVKPTILGMRVDVVDDVTCYWEAQ